MLTIFVRTVILYLVLSVTMKLMGKRQLGELEVGELIVTLLVSEIAALPIGDADVPLLAALVPIIFLTRDLIFRAFMMMHLEKMLLVFRTLQSTVYGFRVFLYWWKRDWMP